ncbi:putative transmembrane protein, partial [Rhizoctonia solani 123E]
MSPPRQEASSSKDSPWESGWRAWINTILSLAVHLFLALLIAIFVGYYVDDNYFNLHDRLPWTSLTDVNGEKVRWDRHAPLQLDITTIVSALLVILRWAIASWTVAFKWRSAFLLVGTNGLRRRSLKQIVRFGLLLPRASIGGPLALFIGVTLFLNTVGQSLSPLLTGSISWVPFNTLARPLTNTTISVPVASPTDEWDRYQKWEEWRQRVTVQAAGFVTSAWQPGDPKGALKRTLHSATGLDVNSTITNVTLPYFSVTSLEWISNTTHDISSYQKDVDKFWRNIGVGYSSALTVPGTVAMIPDQNSTWQNGSFPSPQIRSETRMLVIYTSRLI